MVLSLALFGKDNLGTWVAGISTESAQEMQKAVGGFCVDWRCRGQGCRNCGAKKSPGEDTEMMREREGRLVQLPGMSREPDQEALFKLSRRSGDGAAVIGVGNLPQDDAGVSGLDTARVANGNVAVIFSVDEEDGNGTGGHCFFGRDLLHVEFELPPSAKEGDLHERAKKGASEPRSKVEGLAHAVVGNLAKIGKRRFDGDGAEMRSGIERLQELRGSHRFPEAKDTAGMVPRGEPVEPLVNVVAFEQTVGGEGTAAPAMSAGVWEENGEAVSEQESCIAGHANAVVAEAVEEEHGVAIALAGPDDPGAEDNVILRCNGDVFDLGVEGLAHCGFFFLGQGTARGVQGSVGYEDAADATEHEVQDKEQNRDQGQAAGSSGDGHEASEVNTGRHRVAFPKKTAVTA